MPFARPNVVVLFGQESRRTSRRSRWPSRPEPRRPIAISEAYVPPLLRVGASPWLAGALRNLLARLIAKHRELSAGRRQATAEAHAGRRAARAAAHRARRRNPRARLRERGEGAPPAQAYVALARLAGQLAAFAPDADVAALPKFQHAEPRASFEPILARIEAFVGGMGIERFTRVPLDVRGAMQIARIQDDKILRGQLFLTVKTELPEAQVAEQLPRLCKKSRRSRRDPALVQAAAPGLPLNFAEPSPPPIPVRAGISSSPSFPAGAERLWKSVHNGSYARSSTCRRRSTRWSCPRSTSRNPATS